MRGVDPLYAGLSLVLAQLFNYLQTGSEDPLMLFLGMGGVALGLVFLTLTQSAKEDRPFAPRKRSGSAAPPAGRTGQAGRGLRGSQAARQPASAGRGVRARTDARRYFLLDTFSLFSPSSTSSSFSYSS